MKALLCNPLYYQVEYQINPWMEVGMVNPELALLQWQHLKRVFENLGVKVEVIDQVKAQPDMVFATDQGIPNGQGEIIMSRFRYPQRQGESAYYRRWFETRGYRLVDLPDGDYFEGGGECLVFQNKLLVGTGFRTSAEGANALAGLVKYQVQPLELIDHRFYHLDTCLFVLGKTIFYFPHAFSKASLAFIRKLTPDLVEFTIDDVLQFAANSVVLDNHVLMQSGNERLAAEVSKRGYVPVMIDVSEFMKAGGGIHCLTFWLPE